MISFLRRYGAAFILLGFLVATSMGYWNQSYAFTRHQTQEKCELLKAERPEAECPKWEVQDQRTHFWNGVWENDRSEYEQLLVQFLIMVAFASWIAYKDKETEDRIEAMLEEIKERLESS